MPKSSEGPYHPESTHEIQSKKKKLRERPKPATLIEKNENTFFKYQPQKASSFTFACAFASQHHHSSTASTIKKVAHKKIKKRKGIEKERTQQIVFRGILN